MGGGWEGSFHAPPPGGTLSPPPATVGVDAEMPWPATPNAPRALPPPVRVWRGKAAPRWDTHFVSSEPCPQGELPAALQEADFHVVDFAPVEHHQHVGLGPGPRGAVSDQESAVLKRKGRAVTSRGCRRPTLAAVAVATLPV